MLHLTPDKILIYYDVPQLFIAKDQLGVRYVCLNVDGGGEFAEYVAVPVSIEKLYALILGAIDLRTAFITSETGIWYKVTFNENEDIITSPLDTDQIDEEYLPAKGFYFPKQGYDIEQRNLNVTDKKKEFKVGDVVFINSDNHIKMTISSIDEKGLADCVYYDNNDKRLRHEQLNVNTLTPSFFDRSFDFM